MELEIVDLGMNGEGVGRLSGKIILVPKALIGEIVDIEIVKDYGNYALAKSNKVVSISPNRQIPPCPYAECGGCELMHMDYETQLKFKQDLVRKTIKKIAGIDCTVKPCVPSSKQFAFRNKISFSCTDNAFGMRQNNSHAVVDIDKCMLATDKQNEILRLFKTYCRDNGLNGYNIANKTGTIKNLVIKDFNTGTLVAVVTARHIDLSKFFDILQGKYSNIGLYEVVNTRRDSVVLSGKIEHIGGIKEIALNEFNLKYPIDIMAFHQTNDYTQNEIYSKMLEYINDGDFVVNGFSGAGVLSAIVATKASRVIGIEIDVSAHKCAERLKAQNNVHNLTNICGDFNVEYRKVVNISPNHTLILDPSKKGCGANICAKIRANSIIYLSCNPIALAKDLRELTKNYIIEEIVPFDMFPNTVSVETLVKLKRR